MTACYVCPAVPPKVSVMVYNYDLRPVTTKSQLLTYIGIEEVWFDMACNFNVDAYNQSLQEVIDEETTDGCGKQVCKIIF